MENTERSNWTVNNSLYINPSYITAKYDITRSERTTLQRLHSKRIFAKNDHKGKVSKQSLKKIRSAVQWLVYLANVKKVYDPKLNEWFDYRAGVITLSLPTGQENCTPKFFREVLLRGILDAMEYQFELKNYIWKIELQKRGALHVHITVDQFVNWEWLRDKWCSILDKHGLISDYSEKFSSMSIAQYVKYRQSTDSGNVRDRYPSEARYIAALVRACKQGKNDNWTKPNCTDVHAVKNVRDLSAYLAKYISKDPNLGEDFKGRYWSCSHSLSKLRSVRVDVTDQAFPHVSYILESAYTGLKDLFYIKRDNSDVRFIGAIMFLKKSRAAISTHPILSQVFGIVHALYHSSRLSELPFLRLFLESPGKYQLQTIAIDGN